MRGCAFRGALYLMLGTCTVQYLIISIFSFWGLDTIFTTLTFFKEISCPPPPLHYIYPAPAVTYQSLWRKKFFIRNIWKLFKKILNFQTSSQPTVPGSNRSNGSPLLLILRCSTFYYQKCVNTFEGRAFHFYQSGIPLGHFTFYWSVFLPPLRACECNMIQLWIVIKVLLTLPHTSNLVEVACIPGMVWPPRPSSPPPPPLLCSACCLQLKAVPQLSLCGLCHRAGCCRPTLQKRHGKFTNSATVKLRRHGQGWRWALSNMTYKCQVHLNKSFHLVLGLKIVFS